MKWQLQCRGNEEENPNFSCQIVCEENPSVSDKIQELNKQSTYVPRGELSEEKKISKKLNSCDENGQEKPSNEDMVHTSLPKDAKILKTNMINLQVFGRSGWWRFPDELRLTVGHTNCNDRSNLKA